MSASEQSSGNNWRAKTSKSGARFVHRETDRLIERRDRPRDKFIFRPTERERRGAAVQNELPSTIIDSSQQAVIKCGDGRAATIVIAVVNEVVRTSDIPKGEV